MQPPRASSSPSPCGWNPDLPCAPAIPPRQNAGPDSPANGHTISLTDRSTVTPARVLSPTSTPTQHTPTSAPIAADSEKPADSHKSDQPPAKRKRLTPAEKAAKADEEAKKKKEREELRQQKLAEKARLEKEKQAAKEARQAEKAKKEEAEQEAKAAKQQERDEKRKK